jgi:hypothetical protein
MRNSSPLTCHAHCDSHSLPEAARVGLILAGNIEGGSVIDRRADDGKSEGNIYGTLKINQLHGNVSLVMVHGDHQVVGASRRLQENRIAGVRAAADDALTPRRLNGRGDGPPVLFAEQSVFAGVRIQAAYRNAGCSKPSSFIASLPS